MAKQFVKYLLKDENPPVPMLPTLWQLNYTQLVRFPVTLHIMKAYLGHQGAEKTSNNVE